MDFRFLQRTPGFAAPGRTAAHTLVEVAMAMGILSLVTLGMISAHLLGLRQAELVQSKLGASDLSRRVFGKLTSEIRGAKTLKIGNGTLTSFSGITNGAAQVGNALQMSLTTDTNAFVRYYFETNNARLCRMANGVPGYSVVASSITNGMWFCAQDYRGNTATNLNYKSVVQVGMEFAQYQYPLTRVGPGYYFDYYRLQLKVTPHCPTAQ